MNEKQPLMLQVTDGLSVTVLPHTSHEFLMSTQDVARGYGINDNSLRSQFSRLKDEFIEGKHFVRGAAICSTYQRRVQPHQTFWTKRGVVRLGFFIKTERAKLFRDWAEELVLNVMGQKVPALPPAPKRNHNRLTQERLIDILVDVCRIEDRELRLSLTDKLMGGQQQ